MSYDPKCYELVELFLEDEPELKADLSFAQSMAQEIQTCIEDSIMLRKSELRAEKRKSENPAPE
jgi:hypothetical protein